ncbi:MAG: zinc ribbon domain-containing protein [Oscillospiraceae bacterium]|nr:zinc ribbon domain-containing protein [Oscillospiraceae bacterium]
MKSIKPGRGPSGLKFMNSVFSIVFGVIWTLIATLMAFGTMASGGFGIITLLFPFFGVAFIINGIVHAKYHYKNAAGRDRYSAFDITEDGEESDPGQRWVKGGEPWDQPEGPQPSGGEAGFCPYCGAKLQGDFHFCPKCGRELPS